MGLKFYVTLGKLLAFSEYLIIFLILQIENDTALKELLPMLSHHTNIFTKQALNPLLPLLASLALPSTLLVLSYLS